MAKLHQRIIAFSLAVLFLVTGSALSIFVVYDIVKSRKEATNANSQQASQNQTQGLQGTQLSGFTPTGDVPELVSTDTKVGDGQEVKAGDTVTVDYTGAVAATGTIFQSSKDTGQPAELALDQVIPGWKEGIVGMKVGGERRLVIPADKAYGANPPQGSGIPANAPLVFDITLYKVGK